MARTELTAQAIPTAYTAGMNGVENNLTFTASDNTEGNYVTSTGRDLLLIAYNSGSTADLTVTVTGSTYNPVGTISDGVITVDAGEYGFLPIPATGYTQSDGTIYIDTTDADVKLCVIKL